MANPFVDKMKDLGLRHGEKVGVAAASMIFVICVASAARKETIKTTPDQIKAAAKSSESNLNRREERATIIQRIEEKEIKITDFAKVVDQQIKTALVPDEYKAVRAWVTPEPGAGLIRDAPKLIAVGELFAYPGRGGLLVYELDADGKRIPDPGDDGKAPVTKRRKRKRRAGGGMGGGMMGGMGGGGMMGGGGAKKKARKSQADIDREAKVEQDRQERELKAKLAGKDVPADAKKADDADAEEDIKGKEITKGYRWVAITGVLDHGQMLANYREALKNPAIAHPNYKRLDLQRQSLQTSGGWSDWGNVDEAKNYLVLDNLPELDEELTADNVRPEMLNDPLPLLKAGLWEKVHVASLVAEEKKKAPKNDAPTGGMGGMMSMMGGGMGAGGMGGMMGGGGKGGRGGLGGMGAGMADMMKNMGNSMNPMGGMGAMGGGRGGMMGGMMGGGMMGGGASETLEQFWRSEEKRVMIRALDFTVEPDATYRYRVRIVVFNPNFGREDVTYGTDTKAEELLGPWSAPTDPVHMPPDVMPYVVGTIPSSAKSDIKARFQVIRFNLADGVTVPKPFEAEAGEVIGEVRTAETPVSDGSGKKTKSIDFNTRQIVLDVSGGGYQALPTGMVGPSFERPVLSVLLRPDGSVVVHNEAEDVPNEVRKDIEANYKYELSLSDKDRKKNSTGSGMMSMMQMMMGGKGGGR